MGTDLVVTFPKSGDGLQVKFSGGASLDTPYLQISVERKFIPILQIPFPHNLELSDLSKTLVEAGKVDVDAYQQSFRARRYNEAAG